MAGTFTTLSAQAIPSATDVIHTTGYDTPGLGDGTYVADGLADAALATDHPNFCKSDDDDRYFRLLPVDGAISLSQGGFTGTGNQQAEVQAAINYAVAAGIPRIVNDLGAVAFEMRTPVRTSALTVPPFYTATDGHPLYIPAACKSLHLDFGGATITLLGPDGDTDRTEGQSVAVGGMTWIGGWLRIMGSNDLKFVGVENVIVDGNYAAEDWLSNAETNLYDKAIWIQDTHARKLSLKNVECHHFGGEIAYLAGGYDSNGVGTSYHLENCHFHHSPQSALNPSTTGRLVAINVQAGNAYLPIESLGGLGQDWHGCRFYGGYSATFIGGPDPAFGGGHNYTWNTRRSDAPPPLVQFNGTQFENISGGVLMGSWTTGKIVTVDTTIVWAGNTPCVQDSQLDIEAWCDRSTSFEALSIGGPADLETQIDQEEAGTYYEKPRNLYARVTCHRTANAADPLNNYMHRSAVRVGAGLIDRETVQVDVFGEANGGWELPVAGVTGQEIPLINVSPSFRNLGFGSYAYDYFAADKSYNVAWDRFALNPTGAGPYDITLDDNYKYAVGQRVRFYYGPGWTPGRVLTFAKNGTGLMLNADRTQRRYGEFLDLEWTGLAWREAGYLDQGA